MPSPEAIVAVARTWIGTPYHHQASLKGIGCDCLGLIRGVWRHFYGLEPEALPPYTPDWAEATGKEQMLEAARRFLIPQSITERCPGDVLLFRWKPGTPAKHAAIMSGTRHFIHAYQGSHVLESQETEWWRRRLAYAFRFPSSDRLHAFPAMNGRACCAKGHLGKGFS